MITQQAGTGLGICGDGKGWSGGATRSDGEASQPQRIKEKRPKCFLEIELGKRKLGRIVLELFGDVVPKTVENFRCLCTGEKGISPYSGKPLCYKGSKFHRIIPGSTVLGGDTTKGDGTGGDSIYNPDGDATFADENYKMKHDRAGLVSMAHRGGEPNKNCSSFFFISKPCPKLDGKHVVFGRIIQGLDIMSKLESSGTRSGQPLFESIISDCGELESAAQERRKRKIEELEGPLPPGWEKKESRSKPGLVYYLHESGYTQFDRPSSRARDPLLAMAELSDKRLKEKRLETKTSAPSALDAGEPEQPQVKRGEVRVWHIMKKHKDFFGKPATSWRQKRITWSQDEAKDALAKIRLKLLCVQLGGGTEALQRKFENYCLAESDDNLTAKGGGDLGPCMRSKKLFGDYAIMTAIKKLKQGDISEVIASEEGVHLVARFDG